MGAPACWRPRAETRVTRSTSVAHDTMVAAYLIDPARRTYDLHELAADAGLAAAPGRQPRRASCRLAAEEGDAAGDPAVDARLAGELAERQRERLGEFGVERCSTRSRCR